MQYVKIYFASRVPVLRKLPVNQRVVKLQVHLELGGIDIGLLEANGGAGARCFFTADIKRFDTGLDSRCRRVSLHYVFWCPRHCRSPACNNRSFIASCCVHRLELLSAADPSRNLSRLLEDLRLLPGIDAPVSRFRCDSTGTRRSRLPYRRREFRRRVVTG